MIKELDTKGIQKSFGYKAYVLQEEDGREILFSYGRKIITKKDGSLVRHWDGWSNTTGRHIHAFCMLDKKGYMALKLEA